MEGGMASEEADDITMDEAVAALKTWLSNDVPQIIDEEPDLIPALWAIVQHHERGRHGE